MLLGKVIGTVVATRKNENLVGCKLLVVAPLTSEGNHAGKTIVAVDSVGAGVGEQVLVVEGSPARMVMSRSEAPVDAAIVGIVDSVEISN